MLGSFLVLLVSYPTWQIADFVRRSAELLGIIMAYVVYKITTKDGVCNIEKKEKLERLSNLFVGAMMCLGGIANTLFWRKYTKLNKAEPNAIIAVQARLYRAKSLVDGCVTIALLSVFLFPLHWRTKLK